MSYQQRLFDGYTVTHERGTISSFGIEDEDIKHFRADDVLVFVVTATVSGASYKHDASGDWVRTNKLTTHQVRVADGVMKEEIVEFYNLVGDQLPFRTTSSVQNQYGTSTGSGTASVQPSSGGSTHVQPSVASAGNTSDDTDITDEEEEDNEAEQDFSPPAPASNGSRDAVLNAFLNEQTA